MATRFQADRDLVIVPESQGSKLDPSNRDGVGAKMGIDATKPLAAAEMTFKRIRVPGEEADRRGRGPEGTVRRQLARRLEIIAVLGLPIIQAATAGNYVWRVRLRRARIGARLAT